MDILDYVLIATVLVVNISIGIFVVARNPHSMLNQWFLLMTVGITLWSVTSLVSDTTTSYSVAQWCSWLAYGTSIWALGGAAVFARIFAYGGTNKWYRMLVGSFIPVSVLASTSLVYNLITFEEYSLGILYVPYLVFMAFLLTLVTYNLIHAMRNGTHLQRNQARLILTGLFLLAFVSLVTNAIIPAIIDTVETTKIGPILSIVFVCFAAYAVLRHKLFDMQLFIARSAAYGLLIASLVFIYVLMVFDFAGTLFLDNPFLNRLMPFLAALFIVITTPRLKKLFDRLTNSIFYHDTYDSEVFLNQLNKTLIANIELGILLRRSAQVIETNIKSEFCLFGVVANDRPMRVMGSYTKQLPKRDAAVISEQMMKISDRVIVADDDATHSVELRRVLAEHNVAVLVRLSSVVDQAQVPLAYMMLGAKKSGNMYSRKDLKIIEIVADELVIAIQNALRFEEIQQFNVTLQSRINEATTKLRRSNHKLQEMDEVKDDFISMASHQLRTPLTSVKGYLSMLLDGDAGSLSKQQKSMISQAFVSAQQMTYVVSDLLNVSRLKTGKFVIDRTSTDLVRLVQQEISQLKEVAKTRDLSLKFDAPDSFPLLLLDQVKTRQIIMNFVDNAIYYTPANGHIEIKLIDKPKSIELLVTDDGLGVPKKDHHRLFTKFYRADNAKDARPDGTGLGLFMAKKVVVAQGGAIIFKSQEGKGSTFGFSFPKTKELLADS